MTFSAAVCVGVLGAVVLVCFATATQKGKCRNMWGYQPRDTGPTRPPKGGTGEA